MITFLRSEINYRAIKMNSRLLPRNTDLKSWSLQLRQLETSSTLTLI